MSKCTSFQLLSMKKYYQEHKLELRAKALLRRNKNLLESRRKDREKYLADLEKSRKKSRDKEARRSSRPGAREERNSKFRERYKNDPDFRVKCKLVVMNRHYKAGRVTKEMVVAVES